VRSGGGQQSRPIRQGIQRCGGPASVERPVFPNAVTGPSIWNDRNQSDPVVWPATSKVTRGRRPPVATGSLRAADFALQAGGCTASSALGTLQVLDSICLESASAAVTTRPEHRQSSPVLARTAVPYATVVRLDPSCACVSDTGSHHAEQAVQLRFLSSSCNCCSSSGIICAGPSRFGLTSTARRKSSSARRRLPN